MANIIKLDNDLNIYTPKLSANNVYDISDLSFYIDNDFNNMSLYVLLIDSNNVSDIVPLTFVDISGNYKIFQLNHTANIRVSSGLIALKIILINKDKVITSNESITLNLSVENFAVYHQLFVTRELSENINSIYNKIIEMTKLNIDISEKISQEVRK